MRRASAFPNEPTTIGELMKENTMDASKDGAWVRVPREPSEELLRSMAIRYDHGLGVPGYYDQPIFGAENVGHARRLESTMATMRQLHEEVVGTGFHRASAPPPPAQPFGWVVTSHFSPTDPGALAGKVAVYRAPPAQEAVVASGVDYRARYEWLRGWYLRDGRRSEIHEHGHVVRTTPEIFDAAIDAALSTAPASPSPAEAAGHETAGGNMLRPLPIAGDTQAQPAQGVEAV